MRTTVWTGGTSGFGELALTRLVRQPESRILLGARGDGPAGVETFALDLARQASVRSFAAQVIEALGSQPIDVLVLNAGIQLTSDDARTENGIEVTFATNHLNHYLLLRLLMPHLAPAATIVITSSGTHDPAEGTIIPPPLHADVKLLAHPELNPDHDDKPRAAGGRAYSSSKLANVLTARHLARLAARDNPGWTVIAFDPGATPGTRLVRDYAPPLRFVAWLLGTPVGRPIVSRIPSMNTMQAVAVVLTDLVTGATKPPQGKVYGAVRQGKITWPDPSELAQRDDVAEAMWRDSAELLLVDPAPDRSSS